MRDTIERLNMLATVTNIKTHIYRLPAFGSDRDIAITFQGLTREEAAEVLGTVIKIEQTRTGDVLTPTEYGNRFAGLDLD